MNRKHLKYLIMGVALLGAAMVVAYQIKKIPPIPEEGDEIQTVVTVQIGTVEQDTLHGYVQAYGEVAPDPGNATRAAANLLITARTPGVVKSVHCVEGQKVKSGDLLFEMDSSVAQTALNEARELLKFAQDNVSRQENLLKIEAASEKTVQEARQQLVAAQAILSNAEYERSLTALHATQDGTVIRVNTTQGAMVNPAEVLAEMWDLTRLLVLAKVPTGEAAFLKIGQKVILRTGAASSAAETREETREEGTLIFIDDRVDPLTGTVSIRVAPAKTSELRCGEFVSARVVCTEHARCLTVPEESAVLSPAGETCIAVIDEDVASLYPVITGLKERGRIEVSGAGIRAGMQVVTSGAYGLPDKTRIRILAPH